MLLKSIAIENFQQYEKPFQLTGLSSGINVIYGDNEAGKSTLLRALRAILFDRFNGKGADDFAGYKGGCPEVKIEFELNGSSYSLEKVFSKKKDGRAILSDGKGLQWTGSEAEIQLAELLKFENVERGLAKSEQQGIYGVLWVEQGNAWQQVSISNNPKASQTIQNVLNHELTDMLSQGKGESLLKKFADELNEYQTEKGGKPRGKYKEKLDARESASEKVEELSNELDNYQKKVDQLSDYQQELASLVDDKVEEKDKEQLEQAKRNLKHVEEVNLQYKQRTQDLKLTEITLQNAINALNDRKTLIDNLRQESENHDNLLSQIEELEAKANQFKKNLESAQKDLAIAKKNHEQSQLAIKKARDYQQLVSVQSNIKHIEGQLKKVHTLSSDIKKKQKSISQIRLDAANLKILKKLDEQFKNLQMRFDTIATRIEYSVKDNSVKINDQSVTGNGELLISDRSTISFGNSHIFITPGGEELSTVQESLEAARNQLSAAFEQYSITSMSQAENQVEKRNTLSNEINSLNTQIDVIAPNGMEALEQELAENQLEESRLKSLLGEMKPVLIEEAEAQEELSSIELNKCSDNERHAHDQSVAKEEALKHAKSALSKSKEGLASVKSKLESAQKEHSDDELKKTTQDLAEEKQQLQNKLASFENTLKDLDYEGAASEVERRQGVLDSTRQRITDLKQQVRDLSIELQTSGHRGLAEEKEKAEQELKDISKEVERLSMHVGSLNLLCQLIKENIQTAKEMLVKPITESMAPYLKILFPDSEPVIDEEFSLQYILRDGVREPFENLSIGTREQLAILLRLAYADLLVEKGASVPLILDDALVNSDDLRREKMKQILHRASKKHQIILLTCHGNDYRDSGGQFLSI
ncbi:TPA: AAA family ATPase [Legionella pneumophila]|nr:AAA family ATPase [Legionella pneumophila]HAU1943879.1 AAA family ATPase [Legionella pneumophila]HCX3250693.1 AAA family ATPase [Legionella pneumophila]